MELEIQDVLNKQQGMNLFMDRNLVVFFNLNSTITSYFSLLAFYIVFLGFPCGSASKESAGSAGDLGSSPGLGRSPGEGNGYPLQYPGLENSMDLYIVHGVATSWTPLSNFQFKC